MKQTIQRDLVVIMGVSGCGKTIIAEKLARELGVEFLDGDDFHPKANVTKMAQGIPLNDQDRAGWLQTLNQELLTRQELGRSVILACSALKEKYRTTLKKGITTFALIYLKGDLELIRHRMEKGGSQFFKVSLLDSQFRDLEEPKDALVLDITLKPEELVSLAKNYLTKNVSAS